MNSKNNTQTTSSVDAIYLRVRDMAASFDFMPDERINESELSKHLGVSRTPLREALNRLVAEGLLTFKAGRGFFCRSLIPEQVVNLYELREAIEVEAIRLAAKRASQEEFIKIKEVLLATAKSYDSNDSARNITVLDEQFHLQLSHLSKNLELVRALENIHEKIRYVRWIAIKENLNYTHNAHLSVVENLIDGNADLAISRMRDHIKTSNHDATETVRAAFSQLYVPATKQA